MSKHIVTVIYPDDFQLSFVLNSDASPTDILEDVFAQFNHGSGHESKLFVDSRKRSMSRGDIVLLDGVYHRCESIGWTQMTTQEVIAYEKAIKNHPKREEYGAWYATMAVLREQTTV